MLDLFKEKGSVWEGVGGKVGEQNQIPLGNVKGQQPSFLKKGEAGVDPGFHLVFAFLSIKPMFLKKHLLRTGRSNEGEKQSIDWGSKTS